MRKFVLSKGVLLLVGVALIGVVVLLFQRPEADLGFPEIAYSELLARKDTLKSATIRGRILTSRMTDGRQYMTRLPADPTIATRLADAGVVVNIATPEDSTNWLGMLIANGVPLLFFIWPLLRVARALEVLAKRLPSIVEGQ